MGNAFVTLNSRRAARSRMKLMEEEERWGFEGEQPSGCSPSKLLGLNRAKSHSYLYVFRVPGIRVHFGRTNGNGIFHLGICIPLNGNGRGES
ncbi:hypothetical protein TNCV_3315181 [Trichonephila clavipes]|nr:hypothetical protein TNCV_3315181 [Trichonephila clavipes]